MSDYMNKEEILTLLDKWIAKLQSNPPKLKHQYVGLSEFNKGDMQCCAIGWGIVVGCPEAKVGENTIKFNEEGENFKTVIEKAMHDWETKVGLYKDTSTIIDISDSTHGWDASIEYLNILKHRITNYVG